MKPALLLMAASFAGIAFGVPSCAGASVRPNLAPVPATRAALTSDETLIARFAGNKKGDGQTTRSSLVLDASGTLFGTTQFGGGTFLCKPGAAGCGTVFSLTPSGSGYSKSMIYAFQNDEDGAHPIGGLLDAGGELFGTTSTGGTSKFGTVFKLTPSGSKYTKETLYAFRGDRKRDGANPEGTLISDKSGALYGTTYSGGPFGTVFKLQRSGGTYTETVLHAFTGGPDGGNPIAGVVADKSGALYGTTVYGGSVSSSFCLRSGCGIVYKLKQNGSGYTESIIYIFKGSADGAYPYSGLVIDNAGALYGTTSDGGFLCPFGDGCGTVFKLTPQGSGYTESVIYRFAGGLDGQRPLAGLVLGKSGALYGTTSEQGDAACSCGTVFKLEPAHRGYAEVVLHTFVGGLNDGAQPEADLVSDPSGMVFGTTLGGGTGNNGTVFSILP